MTGLQERFGNLVAAHRRRCGMTQAALAEATELSEDMISRIEARGTGASFKTIEKLSTALEVSAAALFSDAHGAADRQSDALELLRSKLARLSEPEVKWISRIVEASLTPKR